MACFSIQYLHQYLPLPVYEVPAIRVNTSKSTYTFTSVINDMEITINEPNQASGSEITTSQYDEEDNVTSCTPIPATMESYIDQRCHECTTLSLETFLVLQQQQNLGRRFGTSKMHLSPPVA